MAISPPTQADVATLAKVSQSTVSAILRQSGRTGSFDPATRDRVIQAARRLNYRPHLAGISLRSGRTFAIAMVVPRYEAITHTIQARIFQGAGSRARELGYTFSVCTYRHDDESNQDSQPNFRAMLQESRFDGALIYGLQDSVEDVREQVLDELRLPHVVLEKTSDVSASINFDSLIGGRLVTEHLIGLGRRRIAFLGQSETNLPLRDRYRGYQQALALAGLEQDARLVIPMPLVDSPSYYEIGVALAGCLLDANVPVDAIVAATDEMALAAIQVLASRGLRVPQDIAVTGYDDSLSAPMANPPLTSVRQDGVAMGQQAMDMLERSIRGQVDPVEHEVIVPELIIRRSCGAEGHLSTFK